jgi:Response regulator containing a CheY-like receiver domain and an HD-GYP domain
MVNDEQQKMIDILLIEDNPGDVILIKEAFKEGQTYNKLTVVGDGEAALSLLHREGAYEDYPYPDLVLLDLNMPRKDGREVLAEIKTNPALKHIPVVVLTSSEAQQDIINAYNLQANCYITKPVDLKQFFNVVKLIEDFWLKTVKLP